MKNTAVIVSIDIGTTVTKGLAIARDGQIVHELSKSSIPLNLDKFSDNAFANTTFESVVKLVQDIIANVPNRHVELLSITGISPVLVIFMKNRPQHTLSLPYWRMKELDEYLVGQDFFQNRIAYLTSKLNRIERSGSVILDLIGYIVFRLSDKICINSVTLAEAGASRVFADKYPNVEILPPATVCGEVKTSVIGNTGTGIVAGGPDSLGAAFGVGAVNPRDEMIYLGTFGSLLRVSKSLTSVIVDGVDEVPYHWIFSVPNFSPRLSDLCRSLLGNLNWQKFDRLAASSIPGANGYFAGLPRYSAFEEVEGEFTVVIEKGIGRLTNELTARVGLEAFAYALESSLTLASEPEADLFVSGGGSSSPIWRQILANCLNRRITSVEDAHRGLGAARIGAVGIGWIEKDEDLPHTRKIENICSQHDRERTLATKSFAQEWYQSNWDLELAHDQAHL